MMDLKLKYGSEVINLILPSKAVVPKYTEPDFDITKETFVANLLQHLPSDKKKYQNVAIVVSDKTRLCGYPEYLPWLTETLKKQGARKENIHFYIAYGTHPRQSDDESLKTYGEVFNNYHFIHHDCTDDSAFETMGKTCRGTEITIRKDILQSTLLLTFGAISHHYFAGYGGGRKLLFPGLAQRKAIYHNHGLFLDLNTRSLAAGCQPGKLEGNPLAEDLKEIDTFIPEKISIHGIMNASGKVCRLLVGKTYEDFVDACKIHDSYYRFNSDVQFNLVIASSGGYPKDINFIQAHKSVHHAAAFVRDGGNLVILSECIDKIGSNYFMKYLEAGSFDAAFSILAKNYEGNGGTALSMMMKAKRVNIHMLTSLDEKTCATLGVKKIQKEDIQKMINTERGTVAAIGNASILVKKID
jgi:nickel-dependent lactate racemase